MTIGANRTPLESVLAVMVLVKNIIGYLWRFRIRVSRSEVWLAQCLCESNESLPYRKPVESAKAEEQRVRIKTSQSASIDAKNLDPLGRRQPFRLSGSHFILEVPDRIKARPDVRDL